MPRAQKSRAGQIQKSQAGFQFSVPEFVVLKEASPCTLPLLTLGRPPPAPPFKVVPGHKPGSARPQQLCVMTATVKTPIVVEVDEVDQDLATGLAGKASPLPAAPLSCPSCKHSVLPWPQPLPALRGVGAGLVTGCICQPPSSSIPTPKLTVLPTPPANLPPLQAPPRSPTFGFPFS